MNKLLASLLAGAFALTLGTSAFALDTGKVVDKVKETATKKVEETTEPAKAGAATTAAEPAKKEAVVSATEPAKVDAATSATKKHHHKHDKKNVS